MKTNYFTKALILVVSFFFLQTLNSAQAQELKDNQTRIFIKYQDGTTLDTIINESDDEHIHISDDRKCKGKKIKTIRIISNNKDEEVDFDEINEEIEEALNSVKDLDEEIKVKFDITDSEDLDCDVDIDVDIDLDIDNITQMVDSVIATIDFDEINNLHNCDTMIRVYHFKDGKKTEEVDIDKIRANVIRFEKGECLDHEKLKVMTDSISILLKDINLNSIVRSGLVGAKKIFITLDDEDLDDLEEEDEDLVENKHSKNILELNNFRCTPNPSNGQFKIKFSTGNDQDVVVKVFSIEGKQVFDKTMTTLDGFYSEEIDISKKGKGTFILKIIQGKKAYSEKIIVK